MDQPTQTFPKGQRVLVTQQISRRDGVWTTQVNGEVVTYEQKKTGSWFAHSKDDKLWLDRLTLRKDDGEIVVINLDEFTHLDLLDADGNLMPAPTSSAAPPLHGPEVSPPETSPRDRQKTT